MGELLRAICDASCVSQNPAFYAVDIQRATAGGGVFTFGFQATSVLQLKEDTWFLMTGYMQHTSYRIPATGQVGWFTPSTASSFQIKRLNNSRSMFVIAMQRTLANFNVNNSVTLPEYVLFEPKETLSIIQDVALDSNGNPLNTDNFVTLVGIEYKMPERYTPRGR